jgi:hypothetical protein
VVIQPGVQPGIRADGKIRIRREIERVDTGSLNVSRLFDNAARRDPGSLHG